MNRVVPPLLLTFGISACATAAPVPVTKVYQNSVCEASAGIRVLTLTELRELQAQAPRTHLGTTSAPFAPAPDQRLLLLSLGQKPSGGYGIALTAESAEIREATLVLPVVIQQPAPGTLQTAQVTSPCLVVALPAGGYRLVRDPKGIFEIEVDSL